MIGQYANSPVFSKLDNSLTTLFNNTALVQEWFDKVFDVTKANSYGLDIWGKILNRSREFEYNGVKYYLKGAQTIGGVHFTEAEMEELYRKVLQITAMRYVGNASVASINNILSVVFADYGICYCYEYASMHIRYVFQFYVNDVLKAIIETLNPHPTGVTTTYEYLPYGEFVGFITGEDDPEDEPYTPFNDGPFYR